MTWIKKLHWQIVLALGLGLFYGLLANQFGWVEFTDRWITPFGTIFINLLKLCAVPLVIVSLICGVASLSDTAKLGRLGGKTIGAYLVTTAIAITIGLVVANVAGLITPELESSVRDNLINKFGEKSAGVIDSAEQVRQSGPLQAVVDIIPDNFFASVSNNRNMLQVVFLSVFFGVTMVLVGRKTSRPLLDFFNSLNECLITAIRLIIYLAPLGVFALLSSAITSTGNDVGTVVGALAVYGLTVTIALLLHAAIVYPAIVHFLTPVPVIRFFKAIWPAQTFAFSTSSSAATLPITMERCNRGLGIPRENCSFVLPLGATINMDGTALYQAVATIFLANAMDVPLGLGGQISILMIALMASIGTAAVPSAGMVMLVVILEQTRIPTEAIGLIWALDRPLDMLRTAVNVTGDAAVATLVSSAELEKEVDYSSGSPSLPQRSQQNRPRSRNRRRGPGGGSGGGQQGSGQGQSGQSRPQRDRNRDRESQGGPRQGRRGGNQGSGGNQGRSGRQQGDGGGNRGGNSGGQNRGGRPRQDRDDRKNDSSGSDD